MPKKICVIGLAKSGTSALYSSIKKQLSSSAKVVFEPNNHLELKYISQQDRFDGLTKLMFTSLERCQYEPENFTHNVAIVRDPRDILVSSLLFQFNRISLIDDEKRLLSVVSRLKDKEKSPNSVSLVEILNLLEENGAEKRRKWFSKTLSSFGKFLKSEEIFVLKFDDLVAGKLEKLSDYLEMEVQSPEPLDGWIKKINRKGSVGDWKNWFTGQDCIFFSKVMDGFIHQFGFDRSWNLNSYPSIDEKDCSGYVQRLIELRKRDPNLKCAADVDAASLLTAVEDGKYNALMRYYKIYRSSSSKNERTKSLKCILQVGEMGYRRPLLKAGHYYLRTGSLTKASTVYLAAFRQLFMSKLE